MTRHQYTKSIQQELRALNERIDYKILRGIQYADDARRHRLLCRSMARQNKGGFLTRLIPSFF